MKTKRKSARKSSVIQSKKNKVYETFSGVRYYFVVGIIASIAVLLISRLAYLQIIDPEYLSNEADKRSLRITKSVAHRGNIEDRNGEELAISVPAYAIWLDPKTVKKHYAFSFFECDYFIKCTSCFFRIF